MGRQQCRLWWPKNLLSCEPSSDLLLFGWFAHSANSVDVVVAHASSVPEFSVHLGLLDLQEILQSINLKMPVPLQEASTFFMVRHCAVHCRNADMETMIKSYPVLKSTLCHEVVENAATITIRCEDINENFKGNTSVMASHMENHGSWSCGCEILNPSMEPRREVLIRYGNWIQLLYKSQGMLYKKSRWVPGIPSHASKWSFYVQLQRPRI